MKKLIARVSLAIALGIGATAAAATPALAVSIEQTYAPVAAAVTAHTVPAAAVATASQAPLITFNADWPLIIGLLVSTVLPLLVGLVTKTVTDGGIKAAILAALAAATGLLSELGNALATGTPYDLGTGLLTALAAFLVAVGLHFGLWKPTGAAAAAQRAFVAGTSLRSDQG